MAFTQKAIRVIKCVSQPARLQRRAEPRHSRRAARWPNTCTCMSCRGGAATRTSSPIIGGSKVIPQLLRDTRELLADRVGEAAVSNFYLMTRAAYAKLSPAGRQGGAAGGLHPRQHHHPRHRGHGARRADAVPDRPAVAGRVRGLRSSCSPTCSTARWPASAAAAPGSARCWTPPATGSATARCSAGCCGGRRSACASTSLVVATMICLVTSQVISYIKARAEASGLRGDGGLIERPERLIIVLIGAGLSGVPFLHVPWLLHVAMWVLAVASLITLGQRLHTVRTSPGAMEPLPQTTDDRRAQPRNPRRASRDRHAGGTSSAGTPRSGGSRSRSGASSPIWATPRAGGWCARCRSSPARNAFDAGAHLRGPRRRARAAAQEPGPCHRRDRPPRCRTG